MVYFWYGLYYIIKYYSIRMNEVIFLVLHEDKTLTRLGFKIVRLTCALKIGIRALVLTATYHVIDYFNICIWIEMEQSQMM